MRTGSDTVWRLICWLIIVAAFLTVAITAFVYSGSDHREAVQSIAREFFVRVQKASRARPVPGSALVSPTPEGGVIQ
jgi:hypothetical protein